MNIEFRLLESDGTTLRKVLPNIQSFNGPHDPEKFTLIEQLRGIGGVVISGSKGSWDLEITGLIRGSNYEVITDEIDDLEEKLAFNQPYVLEIDKVEGGAEVYSYRVKRLQVITYPPTYRNGRGSQPYTLILKVNSW